MSIIAVSSNSFSQGTEVAKKAAAELAFAFVTDELVRETSEEFDVPEEEIFNAIEAPPSIFDHFSSSQASYIAYYRAIVLRRLCQDNVVCHGLVKHYFVRGIHHALTIRVVANMEERVASIMEREGVSSDEAERLLTKKDEECRQWGMRIFGVDPLDPMLYDAVVHVGKMGTSGAADVICRLASQEHFQATSESRVEIEDRALAAYIEALTQDMQIDAEVTASRGEVTFHLKSTPRVRGGTSPKFKAHFVNDLQHRVCARCASVPGVSHIKVQLREGS